MSPSKGTKASQLADTPRQTSEPTRTAKTEERQDGPLAGWQPDRRVGNRIQALTRRQRVGRIVRVFVDGGYGFIRGRTGQLAYFSAADLSTGAFSSLKAGSKVLFEFSDGGVPKAIQIEVVDT